MIQDKKNNEDNKVINEENILIPDLTNVNEARKAFIMSEILNRKY